MSFTVRPLLADIDALARQNDFENLTEATAILKDLISQGRATLDVEQARSVLGTLRRKRQFQPMIELAEALLGQGMTDVRVRRLYAQALIDSRQIPKAIGVLEALAAQAENGSGEWREAHGLLGRAWKQRYVDGDTTALSRSGRMPLAEAVVEYAVVPAQETLVRDHWHVINFIALCARGERDKVVTGHITPSQAMAKTLIEALEPEVAKKPDDIWMLASLGEAYLARGMYAEARDTYVRYASSPNVDAFELFSSMRQLVEVWELKRAKPGSEILDVLDRYLSARTNDQIAFSSDDRGLVEKLERATATMMPNVGVNGMIPLLWTTKMFERTSSIALLEDAAFKTPLGTGFLVRGASLSAALGDEILLLTNSHVIGTKSLGATPHARAVARFTETPQRAQEFACVAIVWESSRGELDACLIRLSPSPAEFGLMPSVVTNLAAFPSDMSALPQGRQSCLVSGHARGWQLTWTPYPQAIVDLGYKHPSCPRHTFIRHKAPTEPGNSGSPLFNDMWEAIGLHRARQNDGGLKPLGGRPGLVDGDTREAVSLRAIGEQITLDLQAVDVSDQLQLPAPATSVQQIEQEVLAGTDDLGELLAGYEIDPDRSKPFAPVLRAKVPADGSVQGPAGEAAWFLAASVASGVFNTVQNRTFTTKKLARAPKGLTLIAEGDSWFQFPFLHVTDTIGHLRRTHNIFSLARAGQELRQMAADAVVGLGRVLIEFKPDAVLLSGGGNDLVGFNGLALHLHKYMPGRRPEDYLRADVNQTLQLIENHYMQMIDIIGERQTEHGTDIKIFAHGYDHALPRDGAGGWLRKPMIENLGIQDPALQRELVRLLIDRFNDMMAGLETKYPGRFYYVDCRLAVGTHVNSWFDELHPRTPGFARVAGRFNRRIMEAFSGDPRVVGIA